MENKKSFIKFELCDNHNIDKYNESITMIKELYPSEDCGILSLEDYYMYCKQFAAAMGYTEKSIEDWFGEY